MLEIIEMIDLGSELLGFLVELSRNYLTRMKRNELSIVATTDKLIHIKMKDFVDESLMEERKKAYIRTMK